METLIQRLPGDVPGLGKAVHHAARFARVLFTHQPQRVVGGRAGMDDQRLAGLARGADMGAEALALPFHVGDAAAIEPVVVEPGLAGAHHARMRGQCQQALERGVLALLIVRVHAHRGVQVRMLLGQRQHAREVLQRHRDAQRMGDLVGLHVLEQLRQPLGQFREIDMAVGINEHRQSLDAGQSSRRPTITRSRSTPSSTATRGRSPQRAKPWRSNRARLGVLWPKMKPSSVVTPTFGAWAMACSSR
ncbi:hypothetical protein D3C72_1178270 [compost metagenome]